MEITAAHVNKLRQATGAGMMDCKKALTEAGGDFEKAVEILRKTGQKVAAKRADNETPEGVVLVHTDKDGKNAKVLAFACETESVSKVEDFSNLAQAILNAAVKSNAPDLESLKNAQIEDGRTVSEAITELVGKIGEKLIVSDYSNVSGDKVVSYIHSNNKAAAIVAFENVQGADVKELGRDIAMQVVSMKPVGLDKGDVNPALIEKEIEIGKEQARKEGKPENLLEKIAMGKLEKFYKENTLLNQEFVKDPSITIAQLVQNKQKGLKVASFVRVNIGS